MMTETRHVRLKRKPDSEESSRFRQAVVFLLVLGILLVAFMLAIRYVVAVRHDLNSSSTVQSEGLYLQLSMKKTSFAPGEPINIELSAKNVTDRTIKLNFENDLEFDLVVQNEMDLLFAQVPQAVWQYSSESEHFAKPKPHSLTIQPGQEIGFRARWSQHNFKGELVKPGRYCITGFLLAKDRMERLQLRGETK